MAQRRLAIAPPPRAHRAPDRRDRPRHVDRAICFRSCAATTTRGVESFATHHLPLADAPRAYEIFQKKQDGAFKVLLQP
jgi:hypothetical protein